jgi:itaconate CoA-transferase
VFLSVQNEREFASFCHTVLEKPGLASDPRFASGPARLENREAIHDEIERVFSRLQTAEVIRRLDAADIANARLNDMREFWRHAQLDARGRWAKVASPAGEIAALKPPVNLDGMEPRMDPVPALGEHSCKILSELGYSVAEIIRLEQEKAI